MATGGAVMMGTAETFKMTFKDPARSDDIVTNIIEAGEYFGIAVDVAQISEGQMNEVKARLEATKAKLEAQDYAGLTKDEILGDLLYTTAMTYMAEMDAMDYVQASTVNVVNISFPSEAIFKTSLKVDTSYGVPVSASASGLTMDVDRLTSLIKAKDGDSAKKIQFLQTSGMNSSALEHSVPEQLFSTPDNPVEGVSAVKALQIASSEGIPIYTINKTNAATVLPLLQIDPLAIEDISNAVNAGKEVTVSESNINFHGWVGCGYIISDPKTGDGAYMIAGGESGAVILGSLLLASGAWMLLPLFTDLSPSKAYLFPFKLMAAGFVGFLDTFEQNTLEAAEFVVTSIIQGVILGEIVIPGIQLTPVHLILLLFVYMILLNYTLDDFQGVLGVNNAEEILDSLFSSGGE